MVDTQNMRPSRALDRAIAEKVLGLTIETKTFYASNGACSNDLPRYSADIAAAWQIVEHLNNLGWLIASMYQLDKSRDYYIAFTRQSEVPARGGAPTLPMAICIAALQAVKNTDDSKQQL